MVFFGVFALLQLLYVAVPLISKNSSFISHDEQSST
jgi:hypothetical protein